MIRRIFAGALMASALMTAGALTLSTAAGATSDGPVAVAPVERAVYPDAVSIGISAMPPASERGTAVEVVDIGISALPPLAMRSQQQVVGNDVQVMAQTPANNTSTRLPATGINIAIAAGLAGVLLVAGALMQFSGRAPLGNQLMVASSKLFN